MMGANARRKATEETTTRDEKKFSASQDDSLDLQKYIEEEMKQNRIYLKKLKKVDKILKFMLDQDGEEARFSNEYRHMLKKRKQYLMELGEEHASLANLSQRSGGSSTAIMSHDDGSSSSMMGMSISENNNNVEISMANLNFDDDSERMGESEKDRQHRMAKEAKDRERQRQREERLAQKVASTTVTAMASKTASTTATSILDEDDPDVQLVRKKLKKVEKMLQSEKKGSKNEEKLLKKKRQYLAELGEGG